MGHSSTDPTIASGLGTRLVAFVMTRCPVGHRNDHLRNLARTAEVTATSSASVVHFLRSR
jgi:hypothetical protein